MDFKTAILIGTVAVGILVLATRPDEKLRVIFCDVGQGDGILITQGYSQLLVDSGPLNGKIEECLSRRLPFWDRQIETVLISHWDEDHSGGLSRVLGYYRVTNIYSGTEPNGQIEQKSYSGNLVSGDMLSMGMIDFEVKNPKAISGDTNKDSIVGVLNYKDKQILLMGDVDGETEQGLVWREELPAKVEIIKVSHHGSGGSSTKELLIRTEPKTAVISVGKNNRFGHPSREVLERLQNKGVTVRRTDVEGDIVFNFN